MINSMMDENTFENIIICKWNNICRICLNDESLLQPITDYNEQYDMSFYDMINTSTGLNMSPDDTLPQMLCSLCIQQLVNVVEFNIKCQSSESILKKLNARKEDEETDPTNEEIVYIIESASDTEKYTTENSSIDIHLNEEQFDVNTDENYYLGSIPNEEIYDSVENEYPLYKADETVQIRQKEDTIPIKSNNQSKKSCPICNTQYSSFSKLTEHKRSKLHAYSCWKCKVDFQDEDHLREHSKNHNKVNCKTCGKVFNGKSQFAAHVATHSKSKEHLCMVCGKHYATLGSLNVHLRIHTGERKYKCTHCDKTFIHWNGMISHIRNFHTKEKPYKCPVCDKRFAISSDLRKHSFVHSSVRPFPCLVCDMAFKRKESLRDHMYRHTGEKKVICEICDKRFTKTFNLKLHMVTHTGERKHICSICKKAFTQAHVLRHHMKIHSRRSESSTTNESIVKCG